MKENKENCATIIVGIKNEFHIEMVDYIYGKRTTQRKKKFFQ